MSRLERDKIVQYLRASLQQLPRIYVGLDATRLSAIYFCVNGLGILGALDEIDKAAVVEFIYATQLTKSASDSLYPGMFGFSGTFLGIPFGECCRCKEGHRDHAEGEALNFVDASSLKFIQGHLAMLYSAVMTLFVLNDDLSRLDVVSITAGTISYQRL
jgi:geranylgeranyl transferase type-1 subunit beta